MRKIIKNLFTGLILWLIFVCPATLQVSIVAAQADFSNESKTRVEKWMNDWMGATKLPVGSLHLGRFKGPIYFLTKPISWIPNEGQTDHPKVSVPKGFVTDLTSVPRIFWSILRPDGDYTYPAIIHDYLYWTQELPRKEADKIFLLAMEDFGIHPAKIDTIYSAVRVGGGISWSENLAKKNKGGKRILKKFPQDPRITWNDWKKKSNVFKN